MLFFFWLDFFFFFFYGVFAFLVLYKTPPPVALLGFLNVREKEKGLKPPFHGLTCDASFSLHRHYFANPNSEDVRR